MSAKLEDFKKEFEKEREIEPISSWVSRLLDYTEELEEKLLAAAPREIRFKKPTVEELDKFAAEIGYTDLDSQNFIDYYESVLWKVGKKPMKQWRSAVRTWQRRAHPPAPKVEAPVVVTDSMKYFWDAQDIISALNRNEKFNMLLEVKFRQLSPEHKKGIIDQWKTLKEANKINGTWSQLCPP